MTIELQLVPRTGALLKGHDNCLEVLVRAIAPPAPGRLAERKPLNLALVIDKSGSMAGRPLAEAKRCARAIVDRMGAGDFVSVVAYDDNVELVWPAQRRNSPRDLHAAIERICEGSRTALHDGWAAGAEQAARHIKQAGTSRVLLLSDGNANEGLTDTTTIARHCAQLSDTGVTTSTYGLGRGFNETLMLEMAKMGGGTGYYGQTAEDLMGPFQQEFDLLQALCARNLLLDLTAAPGVAMRMLNNLRESDGAWCLPDLAHEAEGWAMVELTVPANLMAIAEGAPLSVLSATVRCDDNNGVRHRIGAALTLEALPVTAFAAVAENALVARRSKELRFGDYQIAAAAAAQRRDWQEVDAILATARETARGHEWLTASMMPLERYAAMRDDAAFSKEATYKTANFHRRTMLHSESANFSVSAEASLPSFFQRMVEEGKKPQA